MSQKPIDLEETLATYARIDTARRAEERAAAPIDFRVVMGPVKSPRVAMFPGPLPLVGPRMPPRPPSFTYWPMQIVEPTTACKHGLGDCDDCGTSNPRDALHTTRGGRGVVGALSRRR